MATIQFKKGDAYLFKLSKLALTAKTGVIGPALYEAGNLIADAIRTELENVPTDNRYVVGNEMAEGPNKYQKEGLMRSLGIAKMRENEAGNYDIKIGFDGYNGIATNRWPNGQPNQMVARSVERGTSWMKPNPFVKRAVNKNRKNAINVMKITVDKKIQEIMRK